MKKIEELKLNKINKSNLEKREMSRLHGGNYCAYSDDNKAANEESGKCSCSCGSGDYYSGLNSNASFYKSTTAWGYC